MNWRGIRALIRKDLTVVLRSKAVLIPIAVVPIILQVLMPAGFGLASSAIPAEAAAGELEDVEQLLRAMPPAVRSQMAGLDQRQLFLVLMVVYLFAPLYLIVPLMVSSVIAADSFAGEKERKTLEALLHTPLTDREMIMGKMLAAWLPAQAAAVISFLLYTVVANAAGWPVMGRLFFPNVMWLVLVLWVSPAASALGLGATVLVSSRVRTMQEAYQLGGVIVVPIIGLMLGQVSGLLFLSAWVAAILGLVLWAIDAIVLAVAVQSFERSEIIARL